MALAVLAFLAAVGLQHRLEVMHLAVVAGEVDDRPVLAFAESVELTSRPFLPPSKLTTTLLIGASGTTAWYRRGGTLAAWRL